MVVLNMEASAFGLPSLNPGDTAAWAMLKFAGMAAFVNPRPQINPWTDPVETSILLLKQDGNDSDEFGRELYGAVEVFAELQRRKEGADRHLSDMQRAESRAFCAMTAAKLGRACMLEAWGDEDNFFGQTAKAYAGTLPVGLSWMLPKMRHQHVCRKFAASREESEAIRLQGASCIDHLERRLGSKSKYFYGQEPTALDAVVSSYVQFAIAAPCPEMRAAVAQAPNLVRHAKRIAAEYFEPIETDLVPEKKTSKPKAAGTGAKDTEESRPTPAELERKRWNRYFLGVCAASLVGYVLLYIDDLIDIED